MAYKLKRKENTEETEELFPVQRLKNDIEMLGMLRTSRLEIDDAESLTSIRSDYRPMMSPQKANYFQIMPKMLKNIAKSEVEHPNMIKSSDTSVDSVCITKLQIKKI